MREVTYGSLFSGIGGMDLGLEMASNDRVRFVCKWQVENNKYAQKVLEKHWTGVQREEDVRFAGAANLPGVDVIIGGFPCQDISYAGKGAGLEGERSGLWYEFARIIRELEPRVVVMENVRALLTRGIDSVLGTLASLGFNAEWHCLSAAAFGAPHIRDRVFVLAYTPSERGCSWDTKRKNATDAWESSFRERENTGRVVSWNSEPTVGQLVNGVSNRLVRFEGRTCSGTPDRAQKLRGLGNAVVPQVMQLVGTWVREMFNE